MRYLYIFWTAVSDKYFIYSRYLSCHDLTVFSALFRFAYKAEGGSKGSWYWQTKRENKLQRTERMSSPVFANPRTLMRWVKRTKEQKEGVSFSVCSEQQREHWPLRADTWSWWVWSPKQTRVYTIHEDGFSAYFVYKHVSKPKRQTKTFIHLPWCSLLPYVNPHEGSDCSDRACVCSQAVNDKANLDKALTVSQPVLGCVRVIKTAEVHHRKISYMRPILPPDVIANLNM